MTLVRTLVAVVALLGMPAHAMAEEEVEDKYTTTDNLYCEPSQSPCYFERGLPKKTKYVAYTYCGTEASHTTPKSIHCSSPSTVVDCAGHDNQHCTCNKNYYNETYNAKTTITCN